MSCGIYKIENKLNGKIYIGQSVHIETRWKEHIRNGKSLISLEISKYGKENFDFSIIEECPQDLLNERERYYIEKYNCIIPDGYNKTLPITGVKHQESFTNYDKDIFNNIIEDIKNSTLSFAEIAEKYSLDKSMIYYLNRGTYHILQNETYPLRQVKDLSKREHYCIDCGAPIGKAAKRCVTCAQLAQRKVADRPDRQTLKKMIREMPFLQIGRIYNVNDNTIRKWCKAENLPTKKTVIKNYSDQEWEKI